MAKKIPTSAKQFDTIGFYQPFRVILLTITLVTHHDADTALHSINHPAQQFFLNGYTLQQNTVVQTTYLSHYITHHQRTNHPLLNRVTAY